MLTIQESNFEEQKTSIVAPSFKILSTANFTVSPWTDRCFWNNIRSPLFSQFFVSKVLEHLSEHSIIKKPSKGSDETIQVVNISGLLLSILHCTVSYPTFVLDQSSLKKFEEYIQMVNSPNFIDPKFTTTINYIFMFLKLFPTKVDNNSLKDLFPKLVQKYDCELMANSIPLFMFHRLIRLVRLGKVDVAQFTTAFHETFKQTLNSQQLLVLFYFLRIFLNLYPHLPVQHLKTLSSSIQLYLTYPFPVSSIAADLGEAIQQLQKYPGFVFL